MLLVSLCTNPLPFITKLLLDFSVILKALQLKTSSLLTIHFPLSQLSVIVIGQAVTPQEDPPLIDFCLLLGNSPIS